VWFFRKKAHSTALATQRQPPAHSSNSWLGKHEDNTVFVFVHGVLSDPGECWFNRETSCYWPDLVATEFGSAGVFLGGYYTGLLSGDYGIRDCAHELFTGLSVATGGYPAVLEHERIVFVCHSLGGIIARYMLEAWRQAFQSQAILLVLIASPSLGSKYAIWLDAVIDLFGNRQGKQLAWRSELIEDLDRRFKDLKNPPPLIPRLMGCEIVEQRFPVPGLERIVTAEAAARYFGDYDVVADSTHTSIVKPPNANANVHLLLRSRYREFANKYPSVLALKHDLTSPTPGVATSVFECQRLIWNLRINPHGDGYNELAFEGITAARSSEGTSSADVAAEYRMAPATVEVGYVSRYVKDSARTSPDIRLEQDRQLREVTARILFGQAPSREMPQKFLLQMLDFHAFMLDRKGLDGDLDYAEKSISFERLEEFLFEVCFPETMSLSTAEPPIVQAYQGFPGRKQRVLDAALTRQAMMGFHFSPMARTAYLRVSNPPCNSSYRIYWRLGDPLEATPAPTDQQLAVSQARREVLLSVRDLIGSADAPEIDKRKVAVFEELARFGTFTSKLLLRVLDAPEVSPVVQALEKDLEINLMAVDNSEKVLKFVAGTRIERVWNITVNLGEGIAGRAATRLQAQYYDDERAQNTVAADGYMALGSDRRHAWLLAVPLWVPPAGGPALGVLNIGTFNPGFGQILRGLNRQDLISELVNEANGRLLPQILNVISSSQGA
jgi:hypothetical protein